MSMMRRELILIKTKIGVQPESPLQERRGMDAFGLW
jgi:hypothetical protein